MIALVQLHADSQSVLTALAVETLTWLGLRSAASPILYGGLGWVGVAYTLQVVAQRHARPSHAAIILSLEAVFSAVAGWIILGEVLSRRALLGCALMLLGMLIAQVGPMLPSLRPRKIPLTTPVPGRD